MAMFERGSVRIRYERFGEGPAVLALAPGGLRSAISQWERPGYNPIEQLRDGFAVVAMDQRTTGESFAPVSAQVGWDDFARDQLGLMDHLGIERFCVVGMCIGGSFVQGLCRVAPERVQAAVMFQPIGLENNRETFHGIFEGWRKDVQTQHPDASEADWTGFRDNLFGGSFQFNTTEEQAAQNSTPTLLFMGDDIYHPQSVSRKLAAIMPNVTFVEEWKTAPHADKVPGLVRAFLLEHTG